MKILVTGGAGFIASQIADAYIEAGHTVTVIDDLSRGSKKNVNARATLHVMDVRDPNISTIFEKNAFDVVNHHAAQIDVRHSMEDPFFDASVNILGTLRLLEAARAFKVKKFIFASSGGVMYGECPQGPANESTVARPISPYGFSKLAAETYVRFYGDQFNLDCTVFRYANVYGPRQDPHGEAGVVAIFAGKLLKKEPVRIFGDGKQVRDYVYVGDIVRANVMALTKGSGQTLNIGTAQATSVVSLYEKMRRFSGSKADPVYAPARAGELEKSVLDASCASREIGWTPAHTLEQGLEATYRHFQSLKNS